MMVAAVIVAVWVGASIVVGPVLSWLFWYAERRDRHLFE
jgi:predicted ferric reductase